MKKLLFAGLVGAALLLASGCRTASPTETIDEGRVTVTFDHPENFADFKDSLSGTARGREDYEYILTRAAREEASRLLKDGQHLSITFTDIDLAGDFLPPESRNGQLRVIKQIYPPRMSLHFRLTDAAGNVVKEGDRRLMDTSFLQTTSAVEREGDLAYDRKLLRDWLRRELR